MGAAVIGGEKMADKAGSVSKTKAKPKVKKARGRPRRSSAAVTQGRLLKAATSMFSAAGYEATRLRQIAGAADVDLATLKYHFGDKQSLYAQVYTTGHQAFIEFIEPIMMAMAEIETEVELREHIGLLSRRVHDFIDLHMPFVRMVLYRFLEDVSEANTAEDELQVIAISMIESTFERLKEKGIVREIDSRSLVTLLITGASMWFVTARVRPHWWGEPDILGSDGRARSEAFITDLIERALIP